MARLAYRASGCERNMLGCRVQRLEVRASEHSQALQIDDADGYIGGVVFSELDDLRRCARRDLRRADDGEWCDILSRGASRLEDSLREERHQTIAATFGSSLHFNCVCDATSSD